MKKEFTMSIREIIKETVVTFVTYTVLSCIACAIVWPLLKWSDKLRKAKEEKEETPSPESFYDVERAEDVLFTDEEDDGDHPASQEEESVAIYR